MTIFNKIIQLLQHQPEHIFDVYRNAPWERQVCGEDIDIGDLVVICPINGKLYKARLQKPRWIWQSKCLHNHTK